jgi:tRNA A37 N6-isopentenylltransferase MiaA
MIGRGRDGTLTKTFFKESKMTEQNKQLPAEAGEGAVAEIIVMEDFETGEDVNTIQCLGYDLIKNLRHGDKLYTSQTTATQAAVAAAMRKCAELVRTQVVWNESVAPDCFAEAILASIPAEANAALEKICTEVAEKCFALGYATHGYFDGDAAGDDLRAIVASVIEKGK